MGDDGVAIADNLAVVVDVGKLSARCVRCVEDVLMRERNLGELEEGVDLKPVAVVIGHAAERGPGIKREHRIVRMREQASIAVHSEWRELRAMAEVRSPPLLAGSFGQQSNGM